MCPAQLRRCVRIVPAQPTTAWHPAMGLQGCKQEPLSPSSATEASGRQVFKLLALPACLGIRNVCRFSKAASGMQHGGCCILRRCCIDRRCCMRMGVVGWPLDPLYLPRSAKIGILIAE